ncbi:MAG: hypothetical protein KGL39_42330 [Patescibacteria group bacterium]|nr:hypothetical protein [Patescibacteria group bacterium]
MTGLRNLNEAMLTTKAGQEPINITRGRRVQRGSVSVFFSDIEQELVAEIGRWPVVFGCMAWLTNRSVLRALAAREVVSIVVQKEDFLRPDWRGPNSEELRELYRRLPSSWDVRMEGGYSICSGYENGAVRCMGICEARDKTPPRMHHKFFVFCEHGRDRAYVPQAVWTGSFNATQNATRSIENAVLIGDAKIAEEYYREFIALLGLSEPLDWTSPYVDPEWRVGT